MVGELVGVLNTHTMNALFLVAMFSGLFAAVFGLRGGMRILMLCGSILRRTQQSTPAHFGT
jgi:hypothetical protein